MTVTQNFYILKISNATSRDLRVFVSKKEVKFQTAPEKGICTILQTSTSSSMSQISSSDTSISALSRSESTSNGTSNNSLNSIEHPAKSLLKQSPETGQQNIPPASSGQFHSSKHGIVFVTVHEMQEDGSFSVVAENTQWVSDGVIIVGNRRLISAKSHKDCWVDERGQNWILEQITRWLQIKDDEVLHTVLEHLKHVRGSEISAKILTRLKDIDTFEELKNSENLKWIVMDALENLENEKNGKVVTKKDIPIDGSYLKKIDDMEQKFLKKIKEFKLHTGKFEKWVKNMVSNYTSLTQKQKQTALVKAIKEGKLEETLAILESGAYVNGPQLQHHQVSGGASPLHWAIIKGNYDIFKALIDSSADIDVLLTRDLQDKTKNVSAVPQSTSLHLAILGGSLSITQYLLNEMVNVNTIDSQGRSPLHIAALTGNIELVEMLLNKNAQTDIKDKNYGSSPLHLACWKGNSSVAAMLIRNGALLEDKDFGNWTPLRWADAGGHVQLVDMLKDFGARA